MTQQRTITKVLAGEEDLLLRGEGVDATATQTRHSGDLPITALSLAVVVEDIAELRTKPATFFTLAFTRSALVAGSFYWDIDESGADDGTNIIQVAGVATGRWVRTHRGSVNPSITAFAGGGQASAVELDRELNAILTVATVGDSVKLPSAQAGMVIHIVNKAANSVDVFPGTGDFLDVAAVNIAAALAGAAKISYRAIDDATWVSF